MYVRYVQYTTCFVYCFYYAFTVSTVCCLLFLLSVVYCFYYAFTVSTVCCLLFLLSVVYCFYYAFTVSTVCTVCSVGYIHVHTMYLRTCYCVTGLTLC